MCGGTGNFQQGIAYTGGSPNFNEMGQQAGPPTGMGYQPRPGYGGPSQAGQIGGMDFAQFMQSPAGAQILQQLRNPAPAPAQPPMGMGNASSIGFQAPSPGYNTNDRGMGAPVAPRTAPVQGGGVPYDRGTLPGGYNINTLYSGGGAPRPVQGGGLLAQPGAGMRAGPVVPQPVQRGVSMGLQPGQLATRLRGY